MSSTHMMDTRSSNSSRIVVPEHLVKKRGLYVSSEIENSTLTKPKVPPRPPPGSKKFLASVFKILSKSTTGTQHPEVSSHPKADRRSRTTNRRRFDEEFCKIRSNIDKMPKKVKYRSKILNNQLNNELIVLQPQKDVMLTPSVLSTPSSDKYQQKTNILQNVSNKLSKEVSDGRNFKKDRRVRIDEPNTLLSELKPINKTIEAVEKSEGKLYNFIVDLLETTISVYNFKTKYDNLDVSPKESCSKINLEIDESVATKLNVHLENDILAKERNSIENKVIPELISSNNFHCDDLDISNKNTNLANEKPYVFKKKKVPQSCSYLKKNEPTKIRTKSLIRSTKLSCKEKKKSTLINIFKEQLKIDLTFKEPSNLYQALKIIANNKKRHQKMPRFVERPLIKKKKKGTDCMIGRRNIISPSPKCDKNDKKIHTPSVQNRTEISHKRQKIIAYTGNSLSHHSIEVLGYDYERKQRNRQSKSFLCHSQESFGSHYLFEFSDSNTIDFF